MFAKLALSKDDVVALIKGLLITMAAAGLTYLYQFVQKADWGTMTPVVMTLAAFLVNFLRKLFDGAMPKIQIVK